MTVYKNLLGKIHSFQSLGTVDGPGVRYVVFMQGCPLRCSCCHNPDTWNLEGGKEFSAEQVASNALHYKEYFGRDGGITVSGGEPLLQAEFVHALFTLCKEEGINTCLDTSGCILSGDVRKLLDVTDRVLLDIKYTTNADYNSYVGCDLDRVLEFLKTLDQKNIKTTLRQVIIPTVNDSEENILRLNNIAKSHRCVDKIELLPFKKICQVKYDQMGIPFPFGNLPTPTSELMARLTNELNEK